MRQAVILHGTGSNNTSNWFPWLKRKLEEIYFKVWVPDLPDADKPNIDAYNKFLLNQGWDFADSLIVGHSSGAVEAISLLENLPSGITADTVVLVGVFRGDLGWEALHGLNVPIDYNKAKLKAKRFIVVHSDNDPYCPLEDAKWIAQQLGAEFKLLPKMQHFSYELDKRFNQFPELLEIITQPTIRTDVKKV